MRVCRFLATAALASAFALAETGISRVGLERLVAVFSLFEQIIIRGGHLVQLVSAMNFGPSHDSTLLIQGKPPHFLVNAADLTSTNCNIDSAASLLLVTF